MHGKDSPEASSPNIKLVKHGFGIYLYNTQNQNPSKYEVKSFICRDIGIEIENKDKENSLFQDSLSTKVHLRKEHIISMAKCSGKMEIAMMETGRKIEWREEVYLNIMRALLSRALSRLTILWTKIFSEIRK